MKDPRCSMQLLCKSEVEFKKLKGKECLKNHLLTDQKGSQG